MAENLEYTEKVGCVSVIEGCNSMIALITKICSAPRFFLNAWRNATKAIPTNAEQALADKAVARDILMRLSRGNVSLKMGKLLTEEMLDARWRRMLRYSFCD